MSIIQESGTPLKKSKSERRYDRKIERANKHKKKDIKLAESITIPQNRIRVNYVPEFCKTPRSSFSPDNYKNSLLSWCMTRADREGDWSWNEPRNWSQEEQNNDIEGHLIPLQNNTWIEIETLTYNGAGNHRKLLNKYQPIDSLCNEAIDRWLLSPELSQFDEIFRFRKGTNKRIWGVRVQHHFFTIWYERYHQICPVDND